LEEEVAEKDTQPKAHMPRRRRGLIGEGKQR
jgi:hypothetical protein